MPLSEQEQRLLDEMERHLLHNDADVVSAPRGDRSLSYRNLVYGALLVLVGVGALIAGVTLGDVVGIVVGVLGFAAMFGGVLFALTPVRHVSPEATRGRPGGRKAGPSGAASVPFMDRMNERWERRQDGR